MEVINLIEVEEDINCECSEMCDGISEIEEDNSVTETNVTYRHGFKFIIVNEKSGRKRLKRACFVVNCIDFPNAKLSRYHCSTHYDQLEDKVTVINELNKKFGIVDNEDKFIINRYGFRYILDNAGTYRMICCFDNECNTLASFKLSGFYCILHYNTLENPDDVINKLKKKLHDAIMQEKEEIEKNSEIINGIKIYFKGGKKYRTKTNGQDLSRVCDYDACHHFAQPDGYCKTHVAGTNPNSPERLEEVRLRYLQASETGKTVAKIGAATEEWVYQMMLLFTTINSVKKIGHESNKLDIIYKVNDDDSWRGIQVKTMCCFDTRYRVTMKSDWYHEDTLMVSVDKERKKYILFFMKDLEKESQSLSISVLKQSDKNKFLYDSLLQFLYNFEKMLKQSATYNENDITTYYLQEKNQLNRLSKKCNELDIPFSINTVVDTTDCFVNHYKIQCKTASCLAYSELYHFTNSKCNGRSDRQPYNAKDTIDFFIYEIVSYPNYFYIIPSEILIEKGYIRTSYQNGKETIRLPNPTSKQQHWATQYINNFEPLLKNPLHKYLCKQLKKNNLNEAFASPMRYSGPV
ncbi:MAG: hypothetical protein Barrevirus3_1 [Barrevirus sp.]|uniref:Uncharacterized protein n=1 Tax=Barrevirus sp. TaxID=2487763 RepID=A0A3G4ZS93_9VIRU|nr:MAG: hypothetical protein Barrevirus3_1 [Barrevirus sp.]